MRFLPTCLLLLAAGPLGAADAYRWVDKDGVVHFSDQPTGGAQRVPLKAAPKPGSVAQTYTPPPGPSNTDFKYTSCAIATPSPDQVFNSVSTVNVSIELEPGFRIGDSIQVTLDGQPVDKWPGGATSYALQELPRGTHTLAATVSSRDGNTLCTAAPVSFVVQQPSLLSPGRGAARH